MNLDALLNTLLDAPIEHHALCKHKPVANIQITPEALEKAYRYAELACEELDTAVECYGYLISPKETKDSIVRDVYLAPNQSVTSAHVRLEPGAVIAAGKELHEGGYRVLGWWHSHGTMETFHSSIDDENIVRVLHGIGATNYVVTYREYPFMDVARLSSNGQSVCIEEEAPDCPSLVAEIKGTHAPFSLPIERVKLRLPIQTGFAYSVVVNGIRGKHFAQLATKEYCYQCAEGEVVNEKSRLVKIPKQYTISMDAESMRKEIREKINKVDNERHPIDSVLDNLEIFFKEEKNDDSQ